MSKLDLLWYTLDDGSKARRSEIIPKIEQLLADGEKTAPDISRHVKLYPQAVHNILRFMMLKGFLTKRKTQRWTYYKLPQTCLLENVLKPEFSKFAQQTLKSKGRKYSLDKSKNISFQRSEYYTGLEKNVSAVSNIEF